MSAAPANTSPPQPSVNPGEGVKDFFPRFGKSGEGGSANGNMYEYDDIDFSPVSTNELSQIRSDLPLRSLLEFIKSRPE